MRREKVGTSMRQVFRERECIHREEGAEGEFYNGAFYVQDMQQLSMDRVMEMAGVVLVDEQRINKPSDTVGATAEIRIKGGNDPTSRYVGRGGLKLEAALREFEINVVGFICLDVGASTGGFTDCLLQNGAKKVTAIDVGHNQID